MKTIQHTSAYKHAQIYTHIHNTHMHTHTDIHTHPQYTYAHTHIHVHRHTCMCTHTVHTHAYTHHTHTHTHAHTHFTLTGGSTSPSTTHSPLCEIEAAISPAGEQLILIIGPLWYPITFSGARRWMGKRKGVRV